MLCFYANCHQRRVIITFLIRGSDGAMGIVQVHDFYQTWLSFLSGVEIVCV